MKICGLKISGFVASASILSLTLVTVVYAGQKPAAAAAAKASPESIANGETLYKRQCQVCHGATGVGDGPASKNLKGKLPNFTDKAVMAKLKDSDINDAITGGLKTEVGNMPAFKAKLKPEEIQDVMNFVHSLAK